MATWSFDTADDRSVFEELSPWWNSCRGASLSPFLRSEWFDLWAKHFVPQSGKLEVVIGMKNGEPAVALPLQKHGLRRSSLSNSHSDLFDLVDGGDPEAGRRARAWLGRQPVTRLFRVAGSSPLAPAVPRAGWEITRTSHAPYVDLQGGSEALTARLPRSLVKDLGRRMRRLGETGEVEFVEDADGGSPDSFEDCLKLEESGWKGHAGSAMLSSTETAGFYRELVELARDQGWLRLSVLTLDGQMTAFELNLEYGGRLHVLKVGYDETLKKASPGNLLSFAVLKAAADRGLETAEWGGEADEYKLRWTDLDRMRVTGLQFGAAGGARLLGMPLRVAARFRGVSARS